MLVDEVSDADVGNAGIGSKTDFACAAVGVAGLDVSGFDLGAEFTEGVGVDFRIGHAFVAGKAAATDFFGDKDVVGAESGKFYNDIVLVHFSHGTGQMKCHGGIGGVEIKTVAQVFPYKLSRLV